MNYVIQRNIIENMKPPGNSEPVKLSVEHILGALFLLLFGHLFACVVLTIEVVYKKSIKKSS